MSGTDGTKYTVHIELEAHDAVSAVVKKLAAEVEKAVNATQGVKGGGGPGTGGGAGEHPQKQIDRVKELSKAWGGLKSSFSGLFDPLRAAASAYQTLSSVTGLSIGGVITGAVGVSKSFEDMQLGMTAMLSSVDRGAGGPYARFADAQTKVTGLMKLMREESIKSAIGLDEIGDSFQTIMPMARGLGVSLEDLVKLSTSTAIADPLGNVARGTTVRDIRQILGGHVSAREIQNPLLRGGIAEYQQAAHDYQELAKSGKVKEARDKQAEILQKIMKVLEQSPEAMAARRGSLGGRMAELKNLIEVNFMEGTKPAYEMLKSVLGDAAEWVSKHPEKIRQAAADFAKFLKGAATAVWDVFKWVYDHWGFVEGAIKAFVGVWALAKVASFITALGSFAKAMTTGTVVDVLKVLAGGKGGGPGVVDTGIGIWAAIKMGLSRLFTGTAATLPSIFLSNTDSVAMKHPLKDAYMSDLDLQSQAVDLQMRWGEGKIPGMVPDVTQAFLTDAFYGPLWEGLRRMPELPSGTPWGDWQRSPTGMGAFAPMGDIAIGRGSAFGDRPTKIEMNINVKADGTVDATATSPGAKLTVNRGAASPTENK